MKPCINQDGTTDRGCQRYPAEHASNVAEAMRGDWNGVQHQYAPFRPTARVRDGFGAKSFPVMIVALPTSVRDYTTIMYSDGEVARVDNSYVYG